MLNIDPEKRTGLFYSIGLHVAIVLLLMVSTQHSTITPPKGIAIQAEIMDLDEYMRSLQKPIKNEPIKKPTPKPEPKSEPVKPEPKKPEPKVPEPKPEPKIEPKPVINPEINELKRVEKTERQKKLEELRRQRQQAEAQVNKPTEKPKEPDAADQQQENQPAAGVVNGAEKARHTMLTQYIGAIQSAVTRQWARPNGTPAGLQCQIKVNQIPGGGVIDVSIGLPCNASAVVRNSIINAVKKADPLPYKGFEQVFERRLNFIFQYQGD